MGVREGSCCKSSDYPSECLIVSRANQVRENALGTGAIIGTGILVLTSVAAGSAAGAAVVTSLISLPADLHALAVDSRNRTGSAAE
jgi:hypothetical protein